MGGGLGRLFQCCDNTDSPYITIGKAGLSDETLATLGEVTLGADVPVFAKEGMPLFLLKVLGEILTPTSPKECWYLVAHPGISIPTPTIFTDPELKRNSPIRLWAHYYRLRLQNDCEMIAKKTFS